MGAPRGGVAGHEEADGHGLWGYFGETARGGGLRKVVRCVLGAEVGHDGDWGGLVGGCYEEGEGETGGEEEDEEVAFEKDILAFGGFGGDEGGKEGGKGGGGENVENGEDGVDEADFFVGDEGEDQRDDDGGSTELELDGL